jgi:hypothetical protein
LFFFINMKVKRYNPREKITLKFPGGYGLNNSIAIIDYQEL